MIYVRTSEQPHKAVLRSTSLLGPRKLQPVLSTAFDKVSLLSYILGFFLSFSVVSLCCHTFFPREDDEVKVNLELTQRSFMVRMVEKAMTREVGTNTENSRVMYACTRAWQRPVT